MYTPHTVSLISYQDGQPYLTILRGVMMQGPDSRAIRAKGAQEEDNVVLFVPFSVRAETVGGKASTFMLPKAYAVTDDPEHHWTLQAEGESAGRCGFYVKEELTEPLSLEEARDRYDRVYAIAGFNIHDYGCPVMRHYEVLSRATSRFYEYS